MAGIALDKSKRGRDNARTPMQWTSGWHAGFTPGILKPYEAAIYLINE